MFGNVTLNSAAPLYFSSKVESQNLTQDEGFTDPLGVVREGKITEPLPTLVPDKCAALYDILKKEQKFTLGNYSCTFTILEILNHLAPHIESIELIGSYTRHLLGVDYFAAALEKIGLKFTGGPFAKPNDIDLRLLLKDSSDPESLVSDVIKFFCKKFNCDEMYHFIKSKGFNKLKTVCQENNQFSIVAIPTEEIPIEFLFIRKLQRNQLFGRDLRLKIPSEWLVNYSEAPVRPFSEHHFGWQACFDLNSKTITLFDVDTVDAYGWLMLIAAYTDGYSCNNPAAEGTLFEKAKNDLETNLDKVLSSHFPDKSAALIFLWNTCVSLSQRAGMEAAEKVWSLFSKKLSCYTFQLPADLKPLFSCDSFALSLALGQVIFYLKQGFQQHLLIPKDLDQGLKTLLAAPSLKPLEKFFEQYQESEQSPRVTSDALADQALIGLESPEALKRTLSCYCLALYCLPNNGKHIKPLLAAYPTLAKPPRKLLDALLKACYGLSLDALDPVRFEVSLIETSIPDLQAVGLSLLLASVNRDSLKIADAFQKKRPLAALKLLNAMAHLLTKAEKAERWNLLASERNDSLLEELIELADGCDTSLDVESLLWCISLLLKQNRIEEARRLLPMTEGKESNKRARIHLEVGKKSLPDTGAALEIWTMGKKEELFSCVKSEEDHFLVELAALLYALETAQAQGIALTLLKTVDPQHISEESKKKISPFLSKQLTAEVKQGQTDNINLQNLLNGDLFDFKLTLLDREISLGQWNQAVKSFFLLCKYDKRKALQERFAKLIQQSELCYNLFSHKLTFELFADDLSLLFSHFNAHFDMGLVPLYLKAGAVTSESFLDLLFQHLNLTPPLKQALTAHQLKIGKALCQTNRTAKFALFLQMPLAFALNEELTLAAYECASPETLLSLAKKGALQKVPAEITIAYVDQLLASQKFALAAEWILLYHDKAFPYARWLTIFIEQKQGTALLSIYPLLDEEEVTLAKQIYEVTQSPEFLLRLATHAKKKELIPLVEECLPRVAPAQALDLAVAYRLENTPLWADLYERIRHDPSLKKKAWNLLREVVEKEKLLQKAPQIRERCWKSALGFLPSEEIQKFLDGTHRLPPDLHAESLPRFLYQSCINIPYLTPQQLNHLLGWYDALAEKMEEKKFMRHCLSSKEEGPFKRGLSLLLTHFESYEVIFALRKCAERQTKCDIAKECRAILKKLQEQPSEPDILQEAFSLTNCLTETSLLFGRYLDEKGSDMRVLKKGLKVLTTQEHPSLLRRAHAHLEHPTVKAAFTEQQIAKYHTDMIYAAFRCGSEALEFLYTQSAFEKEYFDVGMDLILENPGDFEAQVYRLFAAWQKNAPKTMRSQLYFKLWHPEATFERTTSNPDSDPFFTRMTDLLNKIFTRQAAELDSRPELLRFVHQHLNHLAKIYPTQGAVLGPIFLAYITAQVPSGSDLTNHKEKRELLLYMNGKGLLSPLTLYTGAIYLTMKDVPLDDEDMKKRGIEAVLEHFYKHPSPQSAFYMLRVLGSNIQMMLPQSREYIVQQFTLAVKKLTLDPHCQSGRFTLAGNLIEFLFVFYENEKDKEAALTMYKIIEKTLASLIQENHAHLQENLDSLVARAKEVELIDN